MILYCTSMKRRCLILLAIILLGIFLRFWNFGKIPQGFQVDEVSFGYNAYSILKTGKDEYGKFLPLSLRSFDDYKAAGYSYLIIPFIMLFGLTEVAVRLPALVIGVLLIPLAYLITKKITKKENLALIVALLSAISPTFVFHSRVQSDPLASVFFVLLGLYAFLHWVEKGRNSYLFITLFLWIMSFFTYQFPRIFILVFLPILFLFYRKNFPKKGLVLFFLAGIVLLSLSFYLFGGNTSSRYSQVSIFKSQAVQLPLEETIREDKKTPPTLTRIFHNKPIAYGRFLLDNYFQYFSFDFLFFAAQSPARERVPDTGVLYLIELPFLLIGVYNIIRKKIHWGYFIVTWLLITPAALSFINDESPNMHRFLISVLPLEMIVGYGITEFFIYIKAKKRLLYKPFLLLVPLIFTYCVFYFMHELFVHQPVHRPWTRNYPYKKLVAEVDKLAPNYKKIIMTTSESNMYIFLLFYNKYDPKTYQSITYNAIKDNTYKNFDKYIFIHEDCPLYSGVDGGDTTAAGELHVLYVDRGNCINPTNARLLKIIKWGDKSPAFKLYDLRFVTRPPVSEQL